MVRIGLQRLTQPPSRLIQEIGLKEEPAQVVRDTWISGRFLIRLDPRTIRSIVILQFQLDFAQCPVTIRRSAIELNGPLDLRFRAFKLAPIQMRLREPVPTP